MGAQVHASLKDGMCATLETTAASWAAVYMCPVRCQEVDSDGCHTTGVTQEGAMLGIARSWTFEEFITENPYMQSRLGERGFLEAQAFLLNVAENGSTGFSISH